MDMINAVLLGVALLEFLVVYAVVHSLRKRVNECQGCAADLVNAHQVVAELVALAEAVKGVGMESPWYYQKGVAVERARFILEGRYPKYHHLKRGTDYRLLVPGGIRLNFSGRLRDGDDMVLYQDLDTGRLSVRGREEFMDGRFMSWTEVAGRQVQI